MKAIKNNFDLVVVAVVIGGFVCVAGQKLATVPVPEGDEAFTLQVAYEMLNHGTLGLPMYRYLGGNIENVWHSFTPVYFAVLAGFFKLFGYGLLQGRAFNLATAVLTLAITYVIGRRFFNWRAGLIAVVLLLSDQTFIERSRLLRNDYAAAALAMLAFYVYEIAEQRKRSSLFVASGIIAGLGVMCHTNVLYMLVAVTLLMLIRRGPRLFTTKPFYLFHVSALVVMAYEIIYDIADYKNVLLQWRQDKLHFRMLEGWGFWRYILRERVRYLKWSAPSEAFPTVPRNLVHVFQCMTIVAILYLVVWSARRLKREGGSSDPRTHLLLVTLLLVLFLAILGGNKDIYYLAHLAPWFALCAGVFVSDQLDLINRLKIAQWKKAKFLYGAALSVVAVIVIAFGYQLTMQYKRYITEVRRPDQASFEEFSVVLRSMVPPGLCPVAAKAPVIWLAFPEADRCFAVIEERMIQDVDIDGKDYALVARPGRGWLGEPREKYALLGELRQTPYGDLDVYYTGADPRYMSLAPKRYQFFNRRSGHDTEEVSEMTR